MADVKAVFVNSGTNIRARVNSNNNEFTVTNYAVNAGRVGFGELFDVDVSSIGDGSVMVYNGNRQVWEATQTMENQNTTINGGNF